MITSKKWLSQYVDLSDISVEELADIVEVVYGILESMNVSIEEFEKVRKDTKPINAPNIQPSFMLIIPIKSFCLRYASTNADKHKINPNSKSGFLHSPKFSSSNLRYSPRVSPYRLSTSS